jgi:hypothetical protein
MPTSDIIMMAGIWTVYRTQRCRNLQASSTFFSINWFIFNVLLKTARQHVTGQAVSSRSSTVGIVSH